MVSCPRRPDAVGVLISRFGIVEYVIVGDERSLFIPEPLTIPGKKRLRGLRLCHTHLRGNCFRRRPPDLALLRLDPLRR
jgi:GTP-binding protein HflX